MKGFGSLIIIGLIVWGFLLWDSAETKEYEARLEHIDNAETDDRCAEFRQEVEGEWSLGYAGRIRQVVRGCF